MNVHAAIAPLLAANTRFTPCAPPVFVCYRTTPCCNEIFHLPTGALVKASMRPVVTAAFFCIRTQCVRNTFYGRWHMASPRDESNHRTDGTNHSYARRFPARDFGGHQQVHWIFPSTSFPARLPMSALRANNQHTPGTSSQMLTTHCERFRQQLQYTCFHC